MSEVVIRADGLGKRYMLQHRQGNRSDSLVDAFTGGISRLFSPHTKTTEEFWAVRDLNFEIHRGDRVGIIGRNGAGKSTLLKMLSRIVHPTTGRFEYEGRMASLLEVGTGFHGDLTGRENIYLNGSILGMTRREIDARFDEIVAFSEVEQFLDTPVKRYSSGMYVRLAFAVAAHINPDILVVDEVLAVGDAAFQKKCLGKLNEVSNTQGKTILFVSHNMGQIAGLCNRGILLSGGRVETDGNIQSVISRYHQSGNIGTAARQFNDESNAETIIRSITLKNAAGQVTGNFAHDEDIQIEVVLECRVLLTDLLLGLSFFDLNDRRIFTAQTPLAGKISAGERRSFIVTIPANSLTANSIQLTAALHIPNLQMVDEKRNALSFTVYDNGSEFARYGNTDVGAVFVPCRWEVKT